MTRSTKMLWCILFAALFFIASIVVEVVMIRNFLKAREAVNWPTTQGTILRSELNKQQHIRDSAYEVKIEYEYSIGEKPYKSKQVRPRGTSSKKRNEVAPLMEKFPVGKKVVVYYNPIDPSDSLLEAGSDGVDELVVVLPVTTILISGFMLVGFIYLWRKSLKGGDASDEIDERYSSLIKGPKVHINCPVCKTEVSAQTYKNPADVAVTHKEAYVECIPCGVTLTTRLPLEELDQYSADELTSHLYHRISIITKFCAIASVVLFFVPYVGVVLGLIGFLLSQHAGGWVKRLSMIGLVLSLIVSVVFSCLLLWV